MFLNIIFPVERPKAVFIFTFVFIPQRDATMEQTSLRAGANQNRMRIIKKWPHPQSSASKKSLKVNDIWKLTALTTNIMPRETTKMNRNHFPL